MSKRLWIIACLLPAAWAVSGCGSQRQGMNPADAAAPPSDTELSDADDDLDFLDDDFDFLEEEMAREIVLVPDPLEGWNRLMFNVNDALYIHVGRPILRGYAHVVPRPVRTGVDNVFTNLGMPVRAVNSLLQGKAGGTGREVLRFAVNTTAGVLGIWDVASTKYGIPPAIEDLGQTLGVWGFGDGVYLVWPILGPSTLRDSVGRGGDSFLNPVRYVKPCELSAGITVFGAANTGSLHLGDYEALTDDAVDPYAAVRQAYIQYRRKLLEE